MYIFLHRARDRGRCANFAENNSESIKSPVKELFREVRNGRNKMSPATFLN